MTVRAPNSCQTKQDQYHSIYEHKQVFTAASQPDRVTIKPIITQEEAMTSTGHVFELTSVFAAIAVRSDTVSFIVSVNHSLPTMNASSCWNWGFWRPGGGGGALDGA